MAFLLATGGKQAEQNGWPDASHGRKRYILSDTLASVLHSGSQSGLLFFVWGGGASFPKIGRLHVAKSKIVYFFSHLKCKYFPFVRSYLVYIESRASIFWTPLVH